MAENSYIYVGIKKRFRDISCAHPLPDATLLAGGVEFETVFAAVFDFSAGALEQKQAHMRILRNTYNFLICGAAPSGPFISKHYPRCWRNTYCVRNALASCDRKNSYRGCL